MHNFLFNCFFPPNLRPVLCSKSMIAMTYSVALARLPGSPGRPQTLDVSVLPVTTESGSTGTLSHWFSGSLRNLKGHLHVLLLGRCFRSSCCCYPNFARLFSKFICKESKYFHINAILIIKKKISFLRFIPLIHKLHFKFTHEPRKRDNNSITRHLGKILFLIYFDLNKQAERLF